MPSANSKNPAMDDGCPVCGAGRSADTTVCPVCDTDLTVVLEMSRLGQILQDLAERAAAKGQTDRALLYAQLARDVAAGEPEAEGTS